MAIQFDRPPGPHVSTRNRKGFLYLDGDETTDESMRIKRDDDGPTLGRNFQYQFRDDGVWNDTGLRISETSLLVGRDLAIESAGEWIKSFDANRRQHTLVPHVEFDEIGGGILHTPQIDKRQVRLVVQPIEDNETATNFHAVSFFNFRSTLRTGLYFKTGSVSATSAVTLTARRESINGPVFFQRGYSASLFGTPNSEVFLDLRGYIEFAIDKVLHVQLSSDAPFSLRGTSTGDFWVAIDLTPVGSQEVIQDNQTLSRELDLTFDREANWVTRRFF